MKCDAKGCTNQATVELLTHDDINKKRSRREINLYYRYRCDKHRNQK